MAYGRTEHREIACYEYKIRIVAREGAVNDWAAYSENDFTRQHGNSWEMIHVSGDKLYHSDAAKLFPDWDESLHWRL